MTRQVLLLLPLFASLVFARDKAETWLRISSPHFVVVTNAGEKQGRHVADQFERMRSMFHAAFPKADLDPNAPIIVLAIKDEKDFRALEPQEYLVKGSLKLGGLFLPAMDKNYVLMRTDAEGDHPYQVIYHEYTHLLLNKTGSIPLWLNEGLAEFYQNTDIQEKEVALGEVSRENLIWLRQNRLLPLPILLAVDTHSPYYHEENKGSIFYAESWALTHYLEFHDWDQKTHHLSDYLSLVSKNVDPVTAATQAFGDLTELQRQLDKYVQQASYHYLKMKTVTEVDDSAFKVQQLTAPQSDAVRADFLAYDRRTADAEVLLDEVLKDDPKNVSAHETKGFIEFQRGHQEEAKKWYSQAVELDSQSYLAHYYFAVMAMSTTEGAEDPEKILSSLRTSIKLNPSFAPAYDRLAVYHAMRHKDIEEARMMELHAVSLDPANIGYRLNLANIYMTMEKPQSAVEVLRYAAKVAKTPEDSQRVDNMLMQAQEYVQSQELYASERRVTGGGPAEVEGSVSSTDSVAPPHLKHRPEFVAKGPHHFLVGVLKSVHCDDPALDLTLDTQGKLITLHVDNYYKVVFTSLGFQPDHDLNPCSDLENRPAKVEYVEAANPAVTAQLISIELHK